MKNKRQQEILLPLVYSNAYCDITSMTQDYSH